MTSTTTTETLSGERPRRIIKRYSNRKLYDTKDSRYVTLAQIAELVRGGEDVQVIDNATKEDKTEATLALIISEEVKSRPKSVPLSTLRDMVQTRGEQFLSQLREGPIGRLIGQGGEGGEAGADGSAPVAEAPKTEPGKSRLQELVDSSKANLEQWQAGIDERVRAILPNFFRDMQGEVKRLTQRVEQLEAKLKAQMEAGNTVHTSKKGDKE
jgi:polyhydroxyalkanoate synthesis repressor PhaR